jgi:hypothetical protein
MHDIPDSLTDNTSGGKNLIFLKETIRIVFVLGGTKIKVADLANLLEATQASFFAFIPSKLTANYPSKFTAVTPASLLLIALTSLTVTTLASFITDKPSSFIADKES